VKKVIELIRVSTKEQADDKHASIPAQRAINRRTAEIYGLEVTKTIELIDVSRAAVLRTPEMQQLLKTIEDPEIHGVVVKEFSRAMGPENFGDYVLFQAFQDTGTVLYLPTGPIDLNTASGRLLGAINAAISGNEIHLFRERVFAAKEEKRRAGKLAQSEIVLPFAVGYAPDRGFFYKPEAEKIRDAFRRFLSGETSYVTLARSVGVTPRGMHIILRNPIWTGWRVIDMKRDPSRAARRFAAGGRQGDRAKIKRAPEEIIRVKVIDEPLIAEEDFRRVQQMMDSKSLNHWRSRPDTRHVFVYRGFLRCGECGDLLYGINRRNDYYICRRRYQSKSVERCLSPTMRRERLEPKLDELLAHKLTDRSMLHDLIKSLEQRHEAGGSRARMARLEAGMRNLKEKRQRVLESYFEGVVTKENRDVRLTAIDQDIRTSEDMLMRETPSVGLTMKYLLVTFAPLFDWKMLGIEAKRKILAATVPEIHVKDYVVSGVALRAPILPCGDSDSRKDTASVIAAPA
jgi:DNA invertase Pin-like site-specific DNA recombinase